MRSLIVVVACGLVALGCGGGAAEEPDAGVNCTTESRGQSYLAGMVAVGQGGMKIELTTAAPAPPSRFDNAWTVRVLDSSDQPAEGITLEVTPYMPDHGHGTPIVAEVTAGQGVGVFDVSPINLWMPGLWEVRMEVEGTDLSDRMVFSFCIEE